MDFQLGQVLQRVFVEPVGFSTWGVFSKGVRGVRLDFQLGDAFQREFLELGWIFNLGKFFKGSWWS